MKLIETAFGFYPEPLEIDTGADTNPHAPGVRRDRRRGSVE